MDKDKESKELEKLKKAKMRSYAVDDFKKYWTYEDEYKSKKERIVNRCFIAVYSLWHGRLLSRVFYLEEYMRHKKIERSLFEVQRQVAGFSEKISKRLYNGTMVGLKVWTGKGDRGWQITPIKSYMLYNLMDNWNGALITRFMQSNNPMRYIKQSVHKYCAYEYFPDREKEHNHMFLYLEKYEKHPQLEMLIKMGLSHLTYDLRYIRWSKKGLAMLGINKDELPYLRSGFNLQQYRKIRETCLKYKFNVKEANVLWNFYEKKHLIMGRKTELEFSSRMIRYLAKNDISIDFYEDTIRAKNELGLPDERKYLYPDNFVEMHDDLNKRLRLKKYKKIDEAIRKRAEELLKLFVEKDGILIKPLLSQEEFINEGKKLHHCVGGYAKDVAAGEKAIYSIRRVENPDEPLATLELRNKRIIQVRADHNSVPPEDIQMFVRKWEAQYKLCGY